MYMAGERWVDIGEEATFGVAPASAAKSLSYIELEMTADQGRIMEFETAYRMKNFSVLGPFVGSGRFSQYARPHAIGWFLKWALGKVVTTQYGTSAMSKHEFTQDLDNLKSFSWTDCREVEASYALQHLGCLIKGLTLEAPARELVTMEADIQYQWEQRVTKPTIGALETVRPFVFHDGSITSTAGLTVSNLEAFRFQISNTIPDDIHEIRSTDARKIPEIYVESSEWTLELDLKWKSWAARQNFWGGTGTGTEPASEEKEYDVTITLTGAPTGIVDKPNYELIIALPRCVIKEQPA